jgi:hypothetical protein
MDIEDQAGGLSKCTITVSADRRSQGGGTARGRISRVALLGWFADQGTAEGEYI